MKKAKNLIVPIVFTIVLIGISMYNYCSDGCLFFEMKLHNILTLGIAVWVSFYFTQNKLDRRKLKDAVGDTLKKLDAMLNSEVLFDFKDFDETKRLKYNMHTRQVHNYINIVAMHTKELSIKDEIDYIKMQWKEYTDFVDEHTQDEEYLKKSTNTLSKYIINITTKINEVYVKIYSKP